MITHLQWCIWESYALSCVYGYVLWDTQHAHTIADKLHSSRICIKSCIYSTITIWIFLYCYHDSEFYIDISVYRYIAHITTQHMYTLSLSFSPVAAISVSVSDSEYLLQIMIYQSLKLYRNSILLLCPYHFWIGWSTLSIWHLRLSFSWTFYWYG